jgi:integrase/recombinase XerD
MSKLQAALDDYLTIRRALGFKLKLAGWVLGKFVEYADGVGAEVVTADLAIAWARLPDRRSPVWWQYRLDALRGFAKHLQVLDREPRCLLPTSSRGFSGGPSRTSTPTTRSLD